MSSTSAASSAVPRRQQPTATHSTPLLPNLHQHTSLSTQRMLSSMSRQTSVSHCSVAAPRSPKSQEEDPEQLAASSLLLPFFGWPGCSTRGVRLVLCVLLNCAAACVLIPGLSLPLLTVVVRVGRTELLRQTRSTFGTIRFLHSEGAELPAALILIFSCLVPLLKFIVLIVIACWPDFHWRRHLYLFVRNWSKWSMADVFVTAVFVAFLSANAAPATMAAQVEPGFYWFLSYCVLSLLALQVMPKPSLHRWQEGAGLDSALDLPASTSIDENDPHEADLDRLEQLEEQRDQQEPPATGACVSPRGDECQLLHQRAAEIIDVRAAAQNSTLDAPLQSPSKATTPNYSMLRTAASSHTPRQPSAAARDP